MFGTVQVMTFNALSVPMQTHGATMFSLGRYLGGSIGMSLMTTMLARGTQQMHERLGENITVFSDHGALVSGAWDWSTTAGAAALEREITRQAMMIAYLNDFAILTLATLVALPLVFLMRDSRRTAAKSGAAAPPIVAD